MILGRKIRYTRSGSVVVEDVPLTEEEVQDQSGIGLLLDDKVDKVVGKGLSTEDYTTAEKTKLSGVATGATANDTDANLKNRANHTGSQAINTITNLQASLDGKQDSLPSRTGHGGKLVKVKADETGYEYQSGGGGGGDLLAANNLSDLASVPTALTNLGATTVGRNVFALTNPSAVRFLKFNADNTVSARTAAEMLSDIGAQASGSYATGTGTANGTNTGDQTSIVGISGTKAQFDTACSDGNFVYSGDALGTPSSGTLTNCTFPTLNQNTTGSAASVSVSGQTGLLTFTGLASNNRAKTVRDAADTILELGGSYTPTGTWTNMTLVTPALGTPASGNLANCTFPTLNQNTTGSAAKLTTARNIDGQAFDGTANITVIAPGTNAATSKATPVDADEMPLVDSAASNVLKKLTWANLKATLKTYFDTLYQAVLVSGTTIKTINGSSVLGSGDLVVTGSQPDIPMTKIAPTSNQTITAGYGAYVPFMYELVNGVSLEIGAGSYLEIG